MIGISLGISRMTTASSAPFDGVFFDTARSDSFADRMSYTPNAALTVSASSVAFSSSSAVALDLNLKDTNNSVIWNCFDYWAMDATYTVTSFPAVDVTGFFTGGINTGNPVSVFAAETKAHPASTTLLYRRLFLNGAINVSGASGYSFSPGVTARIIIERQGDLLTSTQTFAGVNSETLSKTMVYSATSYELPRLFMMPFVRFVRGVHTLNSLKFSASYPNVKFGFMGDSLTQGRFSTAYGDAFPQLIRADHPGDVLVCAAPSATTADWLNASYSYLKMKPRYTFIILGTNDIGIGRADASIKADYTNLVNQTIASGSIPICLTVAPFNNANVPAFNTWLKAQGWNYIDIYPALLGTGAALNAAYNSGDNVHWNTAGNLVVADLIRAYITANNL